MSEFNIKGVGIVIDDKIFETDSDDSITRIVTNLEELGIPLVKFDSIPAQRYFESFSEISFVLLDWKLLKTPNPTGGQVKRQEDRNIQFIQSLKEHTFAPVFIFSSEAKEDIIEVLEAAKIYTNEKDEDFKNHVFIESKSELIDQEKMINKITSWVENHPSVYVLKSWEDSHRKAKNEAFWQLYNSSPAWPKILWESYEKDMVDEKTGINSIVNKQIMSRALPLEIEKEKLDSSGEVKEEQLKKVLIGTMYLGNDKIRDPNFVPGDIFKKDGEDVYYLNVRPACDTVVNRGGFDSKLYLLRGTPTTLKNIKKEDRYDEKLGLVERNVEVILYGLDGHDFVKFNFKILKIDKVKSLVKNRICRLTPPYINNVTQKYSSYLGRVGLPRLPDNVFN